MSIILNNPCSDRDKEYRDLYDKLFVVTSIPMEKLDTILVDIFIYIASDIYDFIGMWHSPQSPEELIFDIISWNRTDFNVPGKLHMTYDKNFNNLLYIHFEI